jgi:hypothetical protein
METLLANGRAADIPLAVIALEFVVLVLRARRGGRMAAAVALFFVLAPGACLLLALRASLTGAGWPMIAFWLSVSFPIHIGDMLRRRL